MIYQETYQAGGDPSIMNFSSVIYTKSFPFTPPQAFQQRKPTGFPAHCHSFYEISYTIEGSAVYEFDNRKLLSTPGSFIFLPPLSMHSIKADQRSSHLLLQFSPRLIHTLLGSIQNHDLITPSGILQNEGKIQITKGTRLYPYIHDLISISPRLDLHSDDIYRIISGYPFCRELTACGAIFSLLAQLFIQKLLTLKSSAPNMSELTKMQMLISRLVSSPEEKLSMEEAASFVNMSYSNFCRTFKSTLGCSYVDFCNTIRIQRAQELLRHSNMSVTEISAYLNFGSISYFNRIFKKHTGCTPLVYRTSK